MTKEGFELGIKILIIMAVIILIGEVILSYFVIKKKTVSLSVLDDIEKDVSKSELLKERNTEDINLEDLYVEE